MVVPHAKSGEVIDVRPLGTPQAEIRAITLVKTPTLEVRRLVLPKGREIPAHQAPGEITVHCLEGRVDFTAGGTTRWPDALPRRGHPSFARRR